MCHSELIDDICAASAAYMLNMLPQYRALNESELFERLKAHFEAAITAFIHGAAGWNVPEPSTN